VVEGDWRRPRLPHPHLQGDGDAAATFPQDQLKIASYGAPAANQVAAGGSVVFDAQNIPADQELEVRVQFPHGTVEGSAPAWQAADDQRQQYGPVVGVILGGLGFGVAGRRAVGHLSAVVHPRA